MNFYTHPTHAIAKKGRGLHQTYLVMKIIFFLTLVFCLNAAASLKAQRISIAVKNVPLQKVFKEIEKQSEHFFWYNQNDLQGLKPITLNINNATLKDVLQKCETLMPLTFEIVGYNIVVKPKQMAVEGTAPLPQKKIKGRVSNEQGQPITGASIIVKGSGKAVMTGENGAFTIDAKENDVLLISYLGYATLEIKVGRQTDIAVSLKEQTTELTSVSVYSTGYQSLPKERATGSFSTVNNDLFNRQVSTDVISRLKGIAPSLLFDERSTTANRITIRGRSTIFGNAAPLIVLDNFPYEGDINNINPNDIENISILKDAAAASIWGVRAGNGVIVITTKKGIASATPQIELNSNVTLGDKPDLFYQRTMSSSDFIEVERFLFSKNHYNSLFTNPNDHTVISPVVGLLQQAKNNPAQADAINTQIDAMRNYEVRNDLLRYYYRNSVNQQYALNLKGGSERYNYYLSTGFDDNRNNEMGNGNSRLSFNSQQSFKPIKPLELSLLLNYSQNKINNDNVAGFSFLNGVGVFPYSRLADDAGNPLAVTRDYRNSFKQAQTGYLNWDYVPLNELGLSQRTRNTNSFRVAPALKYNIIVGLSLELRYQYEYQTSKVNYTQGADSYFVRNLVNNYTTTSGSTKIQNINPGAIAELSDEELKSSNGRAQLNYNNSFGKHGINALVGAEAREILGSSNTYRLYGLDESTGTYQLPNYSQNFTLYPNNANSAIPSGLNVGNTVDRFRSYYGNAAYTYNGRYTASVSGRIDQSNLFGVKANQKAVPLWSAGLAWNINQEAFYKLAWLPYLKLRATYGYNGNFDNTVTAFTTARRGVGGLAFSTYPSAQIISPSNPNLSWEKIGIYNIGLDFGIKNNRIAGSIEYYHKKGKDLLGNSTAQTLAGVTNYRGNTANMDGSGLDIELNTKNINFGKFNWESTILFSIANDKVTAYKALTDYSSLFTDVSRLGGTGFSPVIGNPLFSVYSVKWAGLDPNTGDPQGYLNGEVSKDYAKLTSPTYVPLDSLVFHGRATPSTFGTLRNNFSLGAFSLSMNFTYRFGYWFKRSTVNYTDLFRNGSTNKSSDYSQRWQKPGDEMFTDVPSIVYPAVSNRDFFYGRTSTLIENGDNIRLQDIQLSYSLSKTNFRKLPFKQVQLYGYANNIGLLWTANDKNIDPDYPNLPLSRTYAIGLRASL